MIKWNKFVNRLFFKQFFVLMMTIEGYLNYHANSVHLKNFLLFFWIKDEI